MWGEVQEPMRVCMSKLSLKRWMDAALMSMTVTSLLGCCAKLLATAEPTWPQPKIKIFIDQPEQTQSFGILTKFYLFCSVG